MNHGVFGNITELIDLPDAAFWTFFVLFVLLCIWLRREDKREGYPMRASPFTDEQLLGFPTPPPPHTYLLNEGGTLQAPHLYEQAPTHAVPLHGHDGTPFSPVGNPLLAGIGPGAWVKRRMGPDLTETGEEIYQPMRVMSGWAIAPGETDPIGMAVFDRRFRPIGRVVDVWIDRGSNVIRMFEVLPPPDLAVGPVLVPIYHTVIKERAREVRVTALHAHQLADIPRPARPTSITAQEHEQLNAYFAAGRFYANSPLTDPPPGRRPFWSQWWTET